MNTNQAVPLDILKHLPELPKPNLDDRTYKDLVDECVLRIPRYCPEWTNHNPADPGITLVELFSWLTDQMLWRFNQVPIRQYIAFLELLGVRLASPKPAKGELSFYLSRAQEAEKRIPAIQVGTEVSTERTDNQEAIIFSTDHELKVGIPHIRNFLIASNISSSSSDLSTGHLGELQDGFYRWSPDDRGSRWSGREQLIFQPTPQKRDGFYLVFGAETLESGEFQSLDGHIITLDIEGELAGPTGINPKRPPRQWEAWNGEYWQPVLLSEEHDETFGFSFDETGQTNQRGARRATITLHMPQNWPQTTFQSQTGAPYTGFLVRCVYQGHNDRHLAGYDAEKPIQPAYRRSPRFKALEVRAVGGIVPATQCTYVGNELLGESNGKPGQEFLLQSEAILERVAGEYLEVFEPGQLEPQIWTEVTDFADSGPNDHHYILDSARGSVQLGPLVREPAQLKEDVEFRQQIQRASYETSSTLDDNERAQQQYGRVPPKGSRLYMKAYRTGGGTIGNLQPGALRILKSAVPYVARVTNYEGTTGGVDGETLDQAVMRVPRLLRTRDRAITIEDYEALALDSSSQIHRAKCLPGRATGRIELLLVPKQPGVPTNHGRFSLSQKLRDEVEDFLQDRSILGTSVQVKPADCVRVKVMVKLLPDNTYPQSAQEEIVQTTKQHLYRFLNPVTGGWSETGWEFGNSLHESDIVGYLHKQRVIGVRSVGDIQLFVWDIQEQHWTLKDNSISLASVQLIDSWASDSEPFMGHVVELV